MRPNAPQLVRSTATTQPQRTATHLLLSEGVGEHVDVDPQQLRAVLQRLVRGAGHFGGLAVLALLECDVACKQRESTQTVSGSGKRCAKIATHERDCTRRRCAKKKPRRTVRGFQTASHGWQFSKSRFPAVSHATNFTNSTA
jgi:hypothetical protein